MAPKAQGPTHVSSTLKSALEELAVEAETRANVALHETMPAKVRGEGGGAFLFDGD